jgi:hypothetical protein
MYQVTTLSNGFFYVTLLNDEKRVVASTVVDGRITNSTLSRLVATTPVVKRSMKQMMLDLFRG